MKTHENMRCKTKCLYCENTFYDIPNLRIHCKTRHANLPADWILNGVEWEIERKDPWRDLPQCEICHKSFKRHENLRNHMQSYHFLNRQVLDCYLCDKTFNSKTNLNSHIRKFHSQLLSLQNHTFNAQNALDNAMGKLNIKTNNSNYKKRVHNN